MTVPFFHQLLGLTEYETGEKHYIDTTKIVCIKTLVGITQVCFENGHLNVREDPLIVSTLIMLAKGFS